MSYAAIASLAPDNTSDATFRAWGSGISTRIANMGLVQTGDTGQINWTSVTHATSVNTSAGYEIWRFADSLQSTVPVYFKLEYGESVNSTSTGLWITIGSGSDGSGTLTGRVTARNQLAPSTGSTIAQTHVFSGDTNRVGVAVATSLANGIEIFFIERAKNTDGSDSSAGILFSSFSGSNIRFMQFLPATLPATSSISDSHIQPPTGATSGAFGTDTAIYPAFLSHGGTYLNACTTHVGYFNADQTRDTTFTITMYGNTHTFYALGNSAGPTSTVGRGGTTLSLAMRYE